VPWDVLYRGTFCALGHFVLWEVLCVGCFVKWDVLCCGTFCAVGRLEMGRFESRTFCAAGPLVPWDV
jgi:hypothetical protein